ncbi:hypothetical protein Agub_g12700 [Astrephomene gubernaculifera]|uniref:Uncharacterized protein n=1 Tax=Astrephomene gubernaculifera TaxID=47775 RepID=A0AAD3HRU9_9CHLO|nr:hypothetical protein Agub_g12700 [Astrephomene gubernaculifera]
MTRNQCKEESVRTVLRPPAGNMASYPREYLATVRTCVMKAWPASGPNATKREVALTLLSDPELRLRVCHLEEILRARQQLARMQGNGNGSGLQFASGSVASTASSIVSGTVRDLPPVQLQTALADPSFAAIFELDTAVNEPDWGMQVLWLNMSQLRRELGLPPPPTPPPPNLATAPPTPPHAATSPISASTMSGAAAFPSGDCTSPPIPGSAPDLGALPSAVESLFSSHPTDDQDYVAAAACFCLLMSRRDAALPPPAPSLPLAELAVLLRGCASVDSRLAAALQRIQGGGISVGSAAFRNGGAGGSGPPAAPQPALMMRLAEVLESPRARLAVRLSEPSSRPSERVASLMVEQLMRAGSGGVAAKPGSGQQMPPTTGLPLEVWRSAVAAASGSEPAAAGTAEEGLPVFLYEYEAPTGVRGKEGMGAPAPALRDQRGGGCASATAVPRLRSGSAAAASPSATSVHTSQGQEPASHCSAYVCHTTMPASAPSPTQSSKVQSLTLSSSNGGGGTEAMSLASAASDPGVPDPQLPGMEAAEAAGTLFRRNTEPPVAAVAGVGSSYGSGGGADFACFPGLAQGFGTSWGAGRTSLGAACAAAGTADGVGLSPGGFNGGARFPLFTGNRSADNLFHNSIGGSSAGVALSSSLGGAGAAHLSPLAASPGGPTSEIAVPRAIADVWSNAPAVSGAGGGCTAAVVGSADAGHGGVFSMSPTQESYLWERVAAGRTASNTLPAVPAGTRPEAATAATGSGMPGLNTGFGSFSGGMGFTSFGGASGIGGLGAGGLVVGSAPPNVFPTFLHSGCGDVVGAGGGVGAGASLMGYAPWQASSSDMAASYLAGHSAPANDAAAGASWLLAHGARTAVTSGGGAAAAVGVGAGGRSAEPLRAVGAPVAATRMATGHSPSVSEESEEAAGVVGGLDLDPLALTLEAIIGLDSASQLGTRSVLSGPTTAAAAPGTAPAAKGLIAAAAAPKAPAASPPGVPHPSSRSFTSATPGTAGNFIAGHGGSSSQHSSLDSSDTVQHSGSNGAVATPAVLTGWSAMAARVAPLAPALYPNVAGVQQQLAAAAAAAGGGGRHVGSPLPPSIMTSGQFAATMAAMGAADGGGSSLAAAMSNACASGTAARDVFGGKVLHPKLTPRVREEICQLVRTVPGLKAEDFDDGVLHQLTLKRSEDEALAALRQLAAENLCGIQHMAAYINHIIKNYHHTGGLGAAGGAGTAGASLPSATVRANSTPVSSKAILQKLPLRVYRRLEEVIAKCSYMEWKHFDAGVVKVMAQLSEMCEEDVFEELELLQSTDLSNVEYMPAYLNKRLNNRLWSRRKVISAAGAGVGGGSGGGGSSSTGP